MKRTKLYLFFLLFFSVSSFGATISFDFPELNITQDEINLTSTPLQPYNPCDFIPATITCTNDPLNLEITLNYPITVTTTALGILQVITLNMTSTPDISKEFNSFVIYEGGSIASFPRSITTNGTINYSIEIKMDYMGLDSLPENVSFFEVKTSSN